MKVKYADQVCFHTLATTGGAGVVNDSDEITGFSDLEASDAILLQKISIAGVDPFEAIAALTEYSLVWGVSGKAFTLNPTVLPQSLLQGASIRAGGLVAGELFFMGGSRDTLDFTDLGSTGVYRRYAARHIYLGISAKNLVASSLTIRVQYDIVSLTSAEMATLFSLLVS